MSHCVFHCTIEYCKNCRFYHKATELQTREDQMYIIKQVWERNRSTCAFVHNRDQIVVNTDIKMEGVRKVA